MSTGRSRTREDGRRAAPRPTTEIKPAPAPPNFTDDEKWNRSKLRCKPLIDCRDAEFKAALQKYTSELQQKSVHNVLTDNFSNHEIRKFESGYVDSKRLPVIYQTQKEDAARFKATMSRWPWMELDENVRSSLAFKLTLMHFGLPVEPMRFTDALNLSGPLANLGFTSTFLDDDEDEIDDDDEMTFVPEELRPLRFLNYYDKRGYGKDNSHSRHQFLLSGFSFAERQTTNLGVPCSEPGQNLGAVLRTSHDGPLEGLELHREPSRRRWRR